MLNLAYRVLQWATIRRCYIAFCLDHLVEVALHAVPLWRLY
jgi:hypothetical protein